jgi:hypothetical protein
MAPLVDRVRDFVFAPGPEVPAQMEPLPVLMPGLRAALRKQGVCTMATQAALRRLKHRGVLVVPVRGFHVIMPLECRRSATLSPEAYIGQLMACLGEPWYAAFQTAAAYYGAGEAPEGEYQVMTTWTRPAISCAGWRIVFFGRANAAEVPVIEKASPWGMIRVSSVEATAVDLVGYGRRLTGRESEATVAALSRGVDPMKMRSAAVLSPRRWLGRIGV